MKETITKQREWKQQYHQNIFNQHNRIHYNMQIIIQDLNSHQEEQQEHV